MYTDRGPWKGSIRVEHCKRQNHFGRPFERLSDVTSCLALISWDYQTDWFHRFPGGFTKSWPAGGTSKGLRSREMLTIRMVREDRRASLSSPLLLLHPCRDCLPGAFQSYPILRALISLSVFWGKFTISTDICLQGIRKAQNLQSWQGGGSENPKYKPKAHWLSGGWDTSMYSKSIYLLALYLVCYGDEQFVPLTRTPESFQSLLIHEMFTETNHCVTSDRPANNYKLT